MKTLDREAKRIENTPAPIVPLCGQDRAGHPKDIVLLAQLACTRCDRFFVVSQLRDEAQPQFDDVTQDGASVTACPGCGQALSLATVYDPKHWEAVSMQLIKRRSEVRDEDDTIAQMERWIGWLQSRASMWNFFSWREKERTQQRAP